MKGDDFSTNLDWGIAIRGFSYLHRLARNNRHSKWVEVLFAVTSVSDIRIMYD